MMRKNLFLLLAAVMALTLAACSQSPGGAEETAASEVPTDKTQSLPEGTAMNTRSQATKALGAMTPEEALAWMKTKKNPVIVDVATTRHYNKKHFEGAIHIPIEELDSEAEDALYGKIPADRPVLLHCRLGMIVPGAYDHVRELRPDIPEIGYIDGAPLFDEYNEWLSAQRPTAQTQILLGGQTPEDALEYMKNTPGLVIVEVNAPEWKLSRGITGAMWIPYTEMAKRHDEIPEGKPVLLHCGGGIVSVKAYEILQETRPDIPELSYIAGVPPVSAYNEWLEKE